MGEEINSALIGIHRVSNSIQKALTAHYSLLVILALASVAAVFALLAVTGLRRRDASVVLRAIFFLILGLGAIPFVLWLWTLRWLPAYLLTIANAIFAFIASWIGPIVGFVFPIVMALSFCVMAIALLVTLLRVWWGRVLLLLVAGAALAFAVFWGDFQSILNAIAAAGSALRTFASYAAGAVGNILAFVGTALAFIVAFIIVASAVMFVLSQFGHIFIDSRFDARNVRKSARAAGRFLVGIGFVASTVILCLPENELARQGAISASLQASEFFGQGMTGPEATALVDNLAAGYLFFVPVSIERDVVEAFSYGYPPSLELILLTAACGIAFLLVGQQLFRKEEGGTVAIAFFPRELLFLLIGAALLLIVVFAAARNDSS